jgi:hypothetical protein
MAQKKGMTIAGWILTGLLGLFFCVLPIMTLINPKDAQEGFEKMGYPGDVLKLLCIVEIVCGLLYVLPWTTIFGAVLLTGYLGGAVATHVRVGDGNWFIAVIFGVLVWLGIYLKDPRVRALMPIFSPLPQSEQPK